MATINGTANPDDLNGANNADEINGLDGNDTLDGFGGNDTLNGGLGADVVNGGLGADLILAGRGDVVHGNEDNDDIRYTGADPTGIATYMYGDAGVDTLTINLSNAVDSITSYNNNGSGGIAGMFYYDIELLVVTGGSASDLITGGVGDDNLNGGGGHDRLVGGAGVNTIKGGGGRDFGSIDVSAAATNRNVVFDPALQLSLAGNKLSQIEGLGLKTGAGKDNIDVSLETIGSEIDAGAGKDTLKGGKGADLLSGGLGDDLITGGRGDIVHGNEDNDLLYAVLDDTTGLATYFYGDAGTDRLTLNFAAAPDPVSTYNNNNGSGGAGGIFYYDIEELELIGGSASDNLVGGTGPDTLTGNAGHDRLIGGVGANLINGGAGRDFGQFDISATGGDRTIVFNPSVTLTLLGSSLSQIEGLGLKSGSGDDSIDVSLEIIGSEIDGGGGADTITGGAAADLLNGGIGNDLIVSQRGDTTHGNDGDDQLRLVLPDPAGAATYVYGDAGIDHIKLDFSTASDAVGTYNNNNGSGGAGGVFYYDMEEVELLGGTASDLLTGGVGADTLTGGTGNDRLVGGKGANLINGGAGLDIGLADLSTLTTDVNVNFKPNQALNVSGNSMSLIEGLGLITGSGDDVIDVSKELIGSEINTGAGDDEIIHGIGADALTGESGADTINAGRDDVVHAGDGNDIVNMTLTEVAGATYVYGEGDQDRLSISFAGVAAAVSSYNNSNGSGGIGGVFYYDTETLNFTGGDGADTLVGGTGQDSLFGGAGGDSLDGRAGDDRYRYSSTSESAAVGAGRDTLLTFDAGDKIDLSAIDADTGAGGNQAFSFRGTNGFNGAGQIRYQASGADTLVQISTDADSDVEMAILIIGTHTLVAGDFVA